MEFSCVTSKLKILAKKNETAKKITKERNDEKSLRLYEGHIHIEIKVQNKHHLVILNETDVKNILASDNIDFIIDSVNDHLVEYVNGMSEDTQLALTN